MPNRLSALQAAKIFKLLNFPKQAAILFLLIFAGSSDVFSEEKCAMDDKLFIEGWGEIGSLPRAFSADPVIAEFIVRGGLRLSLSRNSQRYLEKVTAIVFLYSEKKYVEICRLEKIEIGNIPKSLMVVFPDSQERKIRIELIDHGGGGPTGDPPYTVNTSIYHAAPPDYSPRSQPRKKDPKLEPRCAWANAPTRKQASLQSIFEKNFSASTEGVIDLSYHFAGRNLYIEFNSTESVPVTLKVLAKSSGEGLFEEICTIDARRWPKDKRLAVASLPEERLFYPIWRVEVAVPPGGAVGNRKFSIGVLRDYDPERQSPTEASAPYGTGAGLNAFVCQKPAGRGVIVSQAATSFATRPLLKVSLDDQAQPISATNRLKVRNAILESVALWRRSCSHCLTHQLLLINFEGEYFSLGFRERPFVDAILNGESIPIDRSGSRTPTPGYLPLSDQAAFVKSICSIDKSKITDEISLLKSALECAPNANSSQTPFELGITLTDGFTQCGKDPNIIACEQAGKYVELNIKHFSYVDWRTREKIIGHGRPVDLMSILLHEIGHWMGLTHAANRQNIMAGSFDRARCIDDRAKKSLKEIAEGTLKAVHSEMQAFKYFE